MDSENLHWDLQTTTNQMKSLFSTVPKIGKISITLASLTAASFTMAEDQPSGVPQLSSRPGAAYEIYLNVAGFNYTGSWDGGEPLTPGYTPALNGVSSTGSFSASEQDAIRELWAATAQAYIGFDVNITTVDPAVAAGQAGSDFLRQAYYDTIPNFMHTVVGSGLRDDGNGGTAPWVDGADGISGIAVIGGNNSYYGSRTNFMLTEAQESGNGGPINGTYIGNIIAHENGHAFGLNHQSDYNGDTNVNEYSFGTDNTGAGSMVPILGNASDRQRVVWRFGDADTTVTYPGDPIDTAAHQQNDVQRMLQTNAGLMLADDGTGDSLGTATTLGFVGNEINFVTAQGIIVPASSSNPIALGPENYTQEFFSFTVGDTSEFIVTSHNSTQFLTPGVADGVGGLRSTIQLLDVNGDLIMVSMEAGDTLTTSLATTLEAGDYYLAVGSLGGYQQDSSFNFGDNDYFNMGAFFLTGSLNQIPEPSSALLLLSGLLVIGRRRRA